MRVSEQFQAVESSLLETFRDTLNKHFSDFVQHCSKDFLISEVFSTLSESVILWKGSRPFRISAGHTMSITVSSWMEKAKDPLWLAEKSRVLTKIWSLGSWMGPRIPEKDQMTVSTFSFVPVLGQKAAISYSWSRLGHRKVLCKSLSLNPLGIWCQYKVSPARNPTMNLWSWISELSTSSWVTLRTLPLKILLFCPCYVPSARNDGHKIHFFFRTE